MDPEAAALKTAIAHYRSKPDGIPADVHRRAALYAQTRNDAGETWTAIAERLGVSYTDLRKWMRVRRREQAATRRQLRKASEASEFVQVEVLPPARAAQAPPSSIRLITPLGYQVEGLSVHDAVALLRGLA